MPSSGVCLPGRGDWSPELSLDGGGGGGGAGNLVNSRIEIGLLFLAA